MQLGATGDSATLRLVQSMPARLREGGMAPLCYVNDLWKPLEPGEEEPTGDMVAQTSGGVVNALYNFLGVAFRDEDREPIKELIERRRFSALGAELLTFKGEFLRLAQVTKEGIIVLTIARGGAVKSVNTCQQGESPRALNLREARTLFEGGTMAVVVDTEGAKTVTTLYHPKHAPMGLSLWEQWTPAPRTAPPTSAAPAAPPAVEAPSADVLKSQALILAAREALRPENWALLPVS